MGKEYFHCPLFFVFYRKKSPHTQYYSLFFDFKLACALVTLYTVAGGMVSVAYTGEFYDRDGYERIYL